MAKRKRRNSSSDSSLICIILGVVLVLGVIPYIAGIVVFVGVAYLIFILIRHAYNYFVHDVPEYKLITDDIPAKTSNKKKLIKESDNLHAAQRDWSEWDDSVHMAEGQSGRYDKALYQYIVVLSPDYPTRIKGASGEIYVTSLRSCSCPDFQKRSLPCKHMYKLALDRKVIINLYQWPPGFTNFGGSTVVFNVPNEIPSSNTIHMVHSKNELSPLYKYARAIGLKVSKSASDDQLRETLLSYLAAHKSQKYIFYVYAVDCSVQKKLVGNLYDSPDQDAYIQCAENLSKKTMQHIDDCHTIRKLFNPSPQAKAYQEIAEMLCKK